MNFIKRFTIQTYNIGIVNSDILENGIMSGDIMWLKHKYKDRFFADPFLWFRDELYYYILVEEMCFYEEYGKITLLIVNKNDFSLKSKKVIIEKSFHLSFPFCEENGEEIYPEAANSGNFVKYKISKDTFEILSEEVLMNQGLIDPAILKLDNEEWIFTGHREKPSEELYIYKKNEIGKYQLVNELPILISKENSRSAGIFFNYKGQLMRPTQDCTERYGKKTNIMRIINLTGDKYSDEKFLELSSHNNPPFNETLHTFNFYGDIALIDGSVDVFSLCNIYHKARKLLFRLKKSYKL